MLVVALAWWINSKQQEVIEHVQTENGVRKEELGNFIRFRKALTTTVKAETSHK
jgi:hypothetical protein